MPDPVPPWARPNPNSWPAAVTSQADMRQFVEMMTGCKPENQIDLTHLLPGLAVVLRRCVRLLPLFCASKQQAIRGPTGSDRTAATALDVKHDIRHPKESYHSRIRLLRVCPDQSRCLRVPIQLRWQL